MLPSPGVGVGAGGGQRRELILNSFTFTYCALCPSQKDAKGKRAAGSIIYFHLNMEGRLTLPLPLFRGSLFSSAASPCPPVHVCTDTPHSVGRGDQADLFLLPTLPRGV